MNTAQRFGAAWKTIASVVALVCVLAAVSKRTEAQNPGNNAVYISTGGCCAASSAFIDASVSANSQHTDICATIYNIFAGSHGNPSYPPAGAVIDARGISGSALNCGPNESPWLNGGTYQAKPSVLLLPSGTITIFYTWILPNNTKVVGEGASNTGLTGTLIAAGSGFAGPNVSGYPLSMIQFGDSTATGANCGPCFRISVEDLTLNASGATGLTVDGILNLDSQELTYARRVSLLGITGTGLQNGVVNHGNLGQNAGPYEQIYFSSQNGTACAQIYGAGMRGIHGITCIGNTSASINGGAILVDSSSNSFEDVFVDGFRDGILVGSQASTSSRAWGNVLFNINGGGSVTNVVHLCGSAVTTACPSTSGIAVQDTNIVGVTSGNASGKSIDDEASNVTLADTHVGMYALGEPVSVVTGGIGNSRFTTSPSVPSWFVGGHPAVTHSTCSAAAGSIYSTPASTVGTAWACVGGEWHLVH
jgi:hypothetical protein